MTRPDINAAAPLNRARRDAIAPPTDDDALDGVPEELPGEITEKHVRVDDYDDEAITVVPTGRG